MEKELSVTRHPRDPSHIVSDFGSLPNNYFPLSERIFNVGEWDFNCKYRGV